MPIEFYKASDGLHVRQSFVSPTVYLDHWAILMFSENRTLQDRFVNLLITKGGTLLLSHESFIEFARPADARHSREAEAFLERLLPNIFFTDFRFDKILARERAEPDTRNRFWPTPDLVTLKYFAERAQHKPLGFTMDGLIAQIQDRQDRRAELLNTSDKVARMIIDKLESVRQDSDFIRKAKKSHPSDGRLRTMIIMAELLRGLTLDYATRMSKNDVTDFLHAVMPVNCCDYVLLDGPWTERVEKMKHRIAKAGIDMPIAKCFSQRANGVEAFLSNLETFLQPEGEPPRP